MKFKEIEVSGFKSFADKTNFYIEKKENKINPNDKCLINFIFKSSGKLHKMSRSEFGSRSVPMGQVSRTLSTFELVPASRIAYVAEIEWPIKPTDDAGIESNTACICFSQRS